MEFVVEAAGVADRFAILIASPKRRCLCLAVDAGCPLATVGRRSLLRFDERSVLSVHLVVEATGVAQVVAVPVPTPKGRRRRSAVDAFPTLCA